MKFCQNLREGGKEGAAQDGARCHDQRQGRQDGWKAKGQIQTRR